MNFDTDFSIFFKRKPGAKPIAKIKMINGSIYPTSRAVRSRSPRFSSRVTFPKKTLLIIQSIVTAPKTTPVVAKAV